MVEYQPSFIPTRAADEIFFTLWGDLDWERREDAPRREYWIGPRPYTYGQGRGKRTYYPRISHPLVQWVRDQLPGPLYAGCFLNGYEGERDHLGWHADDDPEIDHTFPIAVVTVGAGRWIQFRHNVTREITGQFLESGSLLLMPAGFQSTHQHRIPKVGYQVGPRISLTFRALVP